MDLVLDTSLLLAGQEPPPGHRLFTTPEASAEVKPGGKDARRFEQWQAMGLQIRSAGLDAADHIADAALQAGNLGRLSPADQSLLALAFERKAILVTDDFTVLDIAARIGIRTQTISTDGIQETKNWQPRCSGCGRWFEDMPKKEECPICGSGVKLKIRD